MDSGNTDLDLLQQQLQKVTLDEKTQEQLDGTPMDIEQPNEVVINNAPEETLEAKNTAVLEVEKPKLKNKSAETNAEKEKYVQSKLSDMNPLKLQPQFMERKAGITAEQKLTSLTQALEAEYEELQELRSQTEFLIQDAVEQNFTPKTEKPWPWESEDSQARLAREKSKNEARLKHYIETNKDDILLKALKEEIRFDLKDKPKDIQQLDNEEKAQAIVQPVANKRISETTQALSALRKDKAYTRYYAKPPVQPKKDITTDFPDLEAAIGLHFRYPLLQKELDKKVKPKLASSSEKEQYRKLIEQNQLKSDKASEVNKNVTEGRVLAERAKRFKPII